VTRRGLSRPNEDNASGSGGLDPQLIAGAQAGLPKCIDRNGGLIFLADPRSASNPLELYFSHDE
jgi:hypothetical protein